MHRDVGSPAGLRAAGCSRHVGCDLGNRMTLKAVKAWSVMLIGIVFAFIGTGVAIKGMIK